MTRPGSVPRFKGTIVFRLHPDIDFLVQRTAQSSHLQILAAAPHLSPISAQGVPRLGYFHMRSRLQRPRTPLHLKPADIYLSGHH